MKEFWKQTIFLSICALMMCFIFWVEASAVFQYFRYDERMSGLTVLSTRILIILMVIFIILPYFILDIKNNWWSSLLVFFILISGYNLVFNFTIYYIEKTELTKEERMALKYEVIRDIESGKIECKDDICPIPKELYWKIGGKVEDLGGGYLFYDPRSGMGETEFIKKEKKE